MEILSIFDPQLFAFRYPNEEYTRDKDTEYNRLKELWTDIEYLRNFAKRYEIEDIEEFIVEIGSQVEYIEDALYKIEHNLQILESFFKALDDNEMPGKTLSLQKGKGRKKGLGLRLYAIRIDENMFVITGGAIKWRDKMNDQEETKLERIKLNQAKAYLEEQGIFDNDSFFEFYISS